jgi:nucleoside-diphosphate-sugar epimerase
VYAITKACAEDLVLARAVWSGLKANVVRAYHAYGPGQKPPPPYGTATVRKIIPAFVCAALAGDPLTVNGTGQQTIDLVHVADVADTLVAAIDGPYGRTIDAGTGRPITVLEAAEDVIRACASDSTTQLAPMRAGEPLIAHVVADARTAVCPSRWPQLDDTIAYYRRYIR